MEGGRAGVEIPVRKQAQGTRLADENGSSKRSTDIGRQKLGWTARRRSRDRSAD